MHPKILEHVDIKNFSTFKMGNKVRYFARAHSEEEILCLVEESKRLSIPFHILGEGSNTVFGDGELNYLFIKMRLKGIEVLEEQSDYVVIRAQAGENWDSFVGYCVDKGLSGIECLSYIPGSVGAAPVQNIGAYGQEIRETLVEVCVFDAQTNELTSLSNEQCAFAYRDSIFKSKEKGRYVICSVVFKLSKAALAAPKYPDVIRYFEERNIQAPTLQQIRDAVVDIRKNKLPDPVVEPNMGSYFKNVIVPAADALRLVSKHPDMPRFDMGDGTFKIPTAWFIDFAGLRGKEFEHVRVHANHALVLVHDGQGTFADLENAEKQIVDAVFEKYGIRIEREPNVLT